MAHLGNLISNLGEFFMIQELSFAESGYINGGGEVSDAVAAAGQAAQALVDAAYDAGYKLGHAVRGLFS